MFTTFIPTLQVHNKAKVGYICWYIHKELLGLQYGHSTWQNPPRCYNLLFNQNCERAEYATHNYSN